MVGLSRSKRCITQFYIAHTREKEGYKTTWYDAIDVPDSKLKSFFARIPKKDEPVYFVVETYTRDVVPVECTKGTYRQPGGMRVGVTHPLAYV